MNEASIFFQSGNEQSRPNLNTSVFSLTNNEQSVSGAGFNTSTKRFDNNYELQLIQQSPDKLQNTSFEYNSETANEWNNQSLQTILDQTRSRIEQHKRNKSENSYVSEGIGFPKALRFTDRIEQSPGPQQYDPMQPQDKVKGVVKIINETKIQIPSHVINNPLNYVKPLIVNLYYRKGNPDVGQYNPFHQEELQKKLKNKIKNSYKAVFDSKIQRDKDFLLQGDRDIVYDENRRCFYDIDQSFKAQEKRKMTMPSPAFQKPFRLAIQKEISSQMQNLIGQEEKPQDSSFGSPEYYGSLDDKLTKIQNRAQFTQNDIATLDRFGNQLILRKPIEEIPGPGYYHDNINFEITKPQITKSGIIQPEGTTVRKIPKIEKSPGPGYYVQDSDPKQVNQNEDTYNYSQDNVKKRGRKSLKDQPYVIVPPEEAQKRRLEMLKIKKIKTDHVNPDQIIVLPPGNQSQIQQYHQEHVQQPHYYTKERVEAAFKKYEQMYQEYLQVGITIRIKHFLQKLPEISKKLKLFEMDREEMLQILMETTKALMMDEFEILNWIKFIDRFDFRKESFAMDIFFIALATKLLMNKQNMKEPIEVYLSITNQQFFYFNYWITINNGRFYQDFQDIMICHKLFKKLNKGLQPKYEPIIPPIEHIQQEPNYNQLVEELIINKDVEEDKSNESTLQTDILDSNLKFTKQVSKQHQNNNALTQIESQYQNKEASLLNHQLHVAQTPMSISLFKKDSITPSFEVNDIFGLYKQQQDNNINNKINNANNDNNKQFMYPQLMMTRSSSKKDNKNSDPSQQGNKPANQNMNFLSLNASSLPQLGSQELQNFLIDNDDDIKNLLSSLTDYSSSQESYSSESDQERAEFIKRAKELLQYDADKQQQQILQVSENNDITTNYDIQDQRFYYQGQLIPNIPDWLNGIENFAQIIKSNSQMILQSLNNNDKEKLFALLPQKVKDKERFMGQIIRGDKVAILGQSPLEQFSLKIQNKVFTKAFQQYSQYQEEFTILKQKEKTIQDLKYIKQLQQKERYLEENSLHVLLNQIIQPLNNLTRDYEENILSSEEDESEEVEYSEEEKEVYNQIHAEFDELTSGYTTISSNRGEYANIRRPINTLYQQGAGSNTLNRLQILSTALQTGIQNAQQEPNSRIGNNSNEQSFASKQDANKLSIKKSSIISLNTKGGSDSATKKGKGSFQAQQEQPFGDQKLLEQIMNSERFKNLKVHKNQVTLPKTTPQWIEIYRRQEEERYKNPTRPWIYYNEDGTTSIVGPLIKKKSQQTNQKPRDHPSLHQNRPAIVTLLCLARDAASRLPDGVGTRADILELIKQSQWLRNEGTDSNSLNNIVSGALDRLHYEDDPCVKYDSDRKLWIYLHKNRTIDYLDWQQQGSGERPNALENNSFNPFIGTEKEDIWKNTPHREKKSYPRNTYQNFEFDNENSESVESSHNKKLIVKIKIDKDIDIKSGNKRSFQNRSGNYEFDQKNKRHKF